MKRHGNLKSTIYSLHDDIEEYECYFIIIKDNKKFHVTDANILHNTLDYDEYKL